MEPTDLSKTIEYLEFRSYLIFHTPNTLDWSFEKLFQLVSIERFTPFENVTLEYRRSNHAIYNSNE